MSESCGKALILGVGGAGTHIVRCLKSMTHASYLKTAVIDTDSSTLIGHPADCCIPASSDWNLKDGTGCGGDVIRGERALARERPAIEKMLQGHDLVVVTAGLGGGTATGGLQSVASVIRKLGIPAVFLVTLPFSFESFSRRKNAESCVAELLPVTDILLTLPDDLLFSQLDPDTSASQAFELAAREMAKTVLGIASVLCCRDLTGSDFAVFMSALRGHRCSCGIGTGAALPEDGLDRSALALSRMLSSPFLGGQDYLKEADAAIVILSGDEDLSLAEMKRNMEQASSLLDPDTEAILGIAVSPENAPSLRLTAIAIHYEELEIQKKKGKKHTVKPGSPAASPDDLFQGELELPTMSRGIFEKYPSIKYHDTDLDVPPFQRNNWHIDKDL